MRVVDIIIKKKQGYKLTKEEIHFIIDGYVKGIIPDYQISSLLMAICFVGLDHEEQVNLTMAMLNSGDKLDLSKLDGICVDKHSTGGVGDKTTLVVAPIVAACGLKIAKMSGRGLGHTGGTLDKLEAIPNFSINVKTEDFFKQVKEIGIAVVGQTVNITPADKKLYALRDVTGTVDSIGLIASSIMSKKLASGAHSILLDVKVGDGAFMKTVEDAKVLAKAMVDIGNSCGRKTVAVLTNMDEPLGNMVGNTLEVIEAIDTLKGQGPKVFSELCYDLSIQMLLMTNVVKSYEEGKKLVLETIENKTALNKLRQMIDYQGGNSKIIDDYSLFKTAKEKIAIYAPRKGYVNKVEALQVGLGAMLLGAGRESKEDIIDPSVGVEVLAKVGDIVDENTIIANIYTNGKNTNEAINKVLNAFTIDDKLKESNKIILGIVE